MTTPCPLCAAAIRDNPLFIAELSESFAILGENQGCPGWCVLVTKEHAEHLAEWPIPRQARLFDDVARTAAAIRTAFPTSGIGNAPPRINYECLGNQVSHVHWHIIPRHANDPTPRLAVWGWTPDQLRGEMTPADRAALAARLRALLA